MPRTSISKAEWLGVLETAAKLEVEQSSAVWVWLMQELRLGPQYFLAVREAVQQGRWRTAKNPKTYIKTVAKREALKMGLVTAVIWFQLAGRGAMASKSLARKRWNTLAIGMTAAKQPKAKTEYGEPGAAEASVRWAGKRAIGVG
jgi:hypothetical protein